MALRRSVVLEIRRDADDGAPFSVIDTDPLANRIRRTPPEALRQRRIHHHDGSSGLIVSIPERLTGDDGNTERSEIIRRDGVGHERQVFASSRLVSLDRYGLRPRVDHSHRRVGGKRRGFDTGVGRAASSSVL